MTPSVTFAILIISCCGFLVPCVDTWGSSCSQGPPGPPGPPGPQGPSGDAGAPEYLDYNNWRQCAWRSANGNDYDTNIYTCTIQKRYSDSALYVAYGGNLRVYGCSGCCKRWYFTFNNNECSPIPIDGVVYQENTYHMNLHRHRNIEGYCHSLGSGQVDVRFAVGDCSGYGNADAYSGWNSVSRIIIREVPASTYGY